MDDAELDVSNRNQILSQSYSQGLERIGCKDSKDTANEFELPSNLIRMREEQWDEFFNRYDKDIGDDLEIDMTADYDDEEAIKNSEDKSGEESDFDLRQLDSDVESEEESGEDEEEEEGEEEEEDYFEKNRAPLRKTPNLIQYWIDTGRPPILMSEELDEFSQLLGTDSKPDLVDSREVEAKRPSNSVLSSVDTAAYILSNTNVTAKAETIAIVEGAKSLDLNDMVVNAQVPGLSNEIDCDIRDKSPVKNSNKKNLSPNKNIKALKITPIKDNQVLDKSIENFNNLNLNNSFSKINDNSSRLISNQNNNNNKTRINNNPIAQCSPKIADVLPTHEDPTKAKVIESSNISKEYDINSPTLTWNNNNNVTTNNGRKSMRKKLYTQSDSPVNNLPTTPISVNSNCNSSDCGRTRNIQFHYESHLGQLHPAFATPSEKKVKVKRMKRASWARRMSRYSKVNKLEAIKCSDDEAEANKSSNSPDKSKSKDDNNVDKSQNSSGKKKRLIKAKKICKIPVRQSMRSKEFINYNEYFSGDEKSDNNKEKGSESIENEEAKKDERSEEIEKENTVEACNLLKVCKQLTINLEPLPVNLIKLTEENSPGVQNLEDSLESEGSTILMFECVNSNKDVNTDTETGTEISQQESEDDKSQDGVKPKVTKPFIKRCLGSMSEKKLKQINAVEVKSIDSDDDSEGGDLTIGSLSKKSVGQNTRERVISFSSDEEDDFSRVLSKNRSKLSETKSDCSKNCDSLLTDLTTESRFTVSSLFAAPTSALRIVGDSDEEILIRQEDLKGKRRSVSSRKSPRIKNKLGINYKKKKLSFAESDSEEEILRKPGKIVSDCIVNKKNDAPLELDKSKFSVKVQVKSLKKSKKLISNKNKFKKRLSKIEEASSDEHIESPPKKIKTVHEEPAINSQLKSRSSVNLKANSPENINSDVKSKEINCNRVTKLAQSPSNDLKELNTPVNNIKSNNVKKRVSFSAIKLEKILTPDDSVCSDGSLFDKINSSSPESVNKSPTVSSVGIKSSGSINSKNVKIFCKRFASDSDDSSD